MNIIIILIWISSITILWLPTTSIKIDEPFKNYEFIAKSISYIMAIFISLLIGIFLGKNV